MPKGLNESLSWEAERVVQRDWTVACEGKWYQLDKCHEALSLAGKKVIVRRRRDGSVQLERGGVKLQWRELAGRPERRKAKPTVAPKEPRKEYKPGTNHPWRTQQIGSVRRTMKRRREDLWWWGTPVGLRYAPASLRPPPPDAGQTTANQEDIIS